VRLQRRADGSNNWTFLRARAAQPRAAQPGTPAAVSADRALARLDIRQVTLENLNVEYVSPRGASHYFDLHKLSAQSPAGQRLKVSLNGAVQKQFPYRLDFTGGVPADLSDPAKPWPVDLTLSFLSSTLTANGTLTGRSGQIRFGLGTENLLEFERLLQTKLPAVGASGIAGTIAFGPGKVSLTQLGAAMGGTSLIGDLDFDYSAARPRVSGALTIPVLDLRPFLSDRPTEETPSAPPKSLAEVYRGLSQASFTLTELTRADADVTLRVASWASLPGNVSDVSLQVKIDNGRLQTPMQATVTGVKLQGNAQVDGTSSPPTFRLVLGTRDSALGGLAELLAGVRGVEGKLGRFDLRLSARGDQVSALVRSLDVRVDIERGRLSYGNIAGGRPVDFTLEKLAVALPAGQALSGEMRGTLLGNALSARLRSGALEPLMLEDRVPIDFSARSGGVRAHVQGVLQLPAENRGPELTFGISAPRAAEVASWFGLRPGAEARAALSGKAVLRSRQWSVTDFSLRLGRSALTAEAVQTGIGTQPLLKVRLAAEQIDLAELESLLPKAQKKESSGPVLNIPILPQGIDLTDADVEVRLKRFLGSTLEVHDVAFDGRMREGYMYPSPFAASVANTALRGAILLDLRSKEPSAGLWLFANDVNIGNLLRKLELARNIDATLDLMQIHLASRSTRLGELIARADLTGNFAGGRVTLRDPNTRAEARIEIESGVLRAAPGDKVRLDLKGSIDDIPVAIGIATASAQDLVNPKLPVPFKLSAEAAATRLELSGAIARPLENREVELALETRGTRFDTLNKLTRASLPPWGPWSAAGKFRMSARGYEVDDLLLQVGESALKGAGRYQNTAGRPRIEIALAAPKVQLDDFRFNDWSPYEKKPAAENDKALSADEIRAKAAEASKQAQELLSPAMLRRQDAYLTVQVDQVLSGQDKLGSGRLEAKLENGRADIGPVELNVPGGSAKLSLGYEPTEQDVNASIHIEAIKFDYGILARRIKPDTDLRGTFSLNVDVTSRARYLADILRNGSGRIDFAVWPQNMQSGIIDLWAVNVLVALVPAVDPGKASKVNCAIGRFELNDGKLVDKTILLDTSRMRVTGKGSADFGAETLYLRMRPQAKTAQFLSLATPIQVSGTFNNFKIGVSPGDVLETVGRLVTSIIWVPLQKMAGKKIPPDGADVCAASLAGEP
ncbi:MAG: AsmA family protein, partial [Betaproteobacteria bacterium]